MARSRSKRSKSPEKRTRRQKSSSSSSSSNNESDSQRDSSSEPSPPSRNVSKKQTARKPSKRKKVKSKSSSSSSSKESSSDSDSKPGKAVPAKVRHDSSSESEVQTKHRKGEKGPGSEEEATSSKKRKNKTKLENKRISARESPAPMERKKHSKSPETKRRHSKSPENRGRRRRSKSPENRKRRSKSPEKRRMRDKSPENRKRRSKSPENRRGRSKSPENRRRRSKSPENRRRSSKSPENRRRRDKSPTKRQSDKEGDKRNRREPSPGPSKVEIKEEEVKCERESDDARVEREEASTSVKQEPVVDDKSFKREVLSGDEKQEAEGRRRHDSEVVEIPTQSISQVGDWVDSDEDAVKIVPTTDDLDWFATKKRQAGKVSGEGVSEESTKRRKRHDTESSSDKNGDTEKTPVYSPARSVTPKIDRVTEYNESRIEDGDEGSPDRVVEGVAEYREDRVDREDEEGEDEVVVPDAHYNETRINRESGDSDGDWFKKEGSDRSPEREPVHNRLGDRPESKERSKDRSHSRDRRRHRSRDRSGSRNRRRSRDRRRDRPDERRNQRSRSRERRGRDDNRRRDDRDRPEHRFRGRNDRDEKRKDEKEKGEEKKDEMLPRKPKPEENPLALRSGGAYMPPHKLRALQASITDKTSEPYQRLTWEALKKSINGLVNKVNTTNIKDLVIELFNENLVRGKGLLIRSMMTAQTQATPFTNVYCAVIAVINTKFPDIGDLLLDRLILQFKRSYLRNQKAICLSTVMFIGHLTNQQVVNEIMCLEILTLLLEKSTADSVEISIALLKEVGARLDELSPRAMHGIFDRLRSLLQEGDLDIRVKYMIEVMFAIRKDKFKDHPIFAPGLELVEEEDQITHLKQLEDKVKGMEILNVFKFDPEYEESIAKYQLIRNEILGSESEGEEGEDESSEEEAEEEQPGMEIEDRTGTNEQALRRTIYLTIQSSLTYEECIHKLTKLQLKPGQDSVLIRMIIECCSQERSYNKFYGLLGERYCRLKREYIPFFVEVFQEQFESIHRLETNKLRNVACCYAHMLYTDAMPWTVFSIIRLTEAETTSSSRVFIKVLLQEIASQMGQKKLKERFGDSTLQVCFEGLFPRDDPRNTRFSINYFTAIGLGYLTEDLREWLKTAPPPAPLLTGLDGSSSSSSSSSDSSSSDSSSSSSDDGKKRKKKLTKQKPEKENVPAPVVPDTHEGATWPTLHASRRPAVQETDRRTRNEEERTGGDANRNTEKDNNRGREMKGEGREEQWLHASRRPPAEDTAGRQRGRGEEDSNRRGEKRAEERSGDDLNRNRDCNRRERKREDSTGDGNKRDRRNREDGTEDGNRRNRRNREDSPEDGNRRERRNREDGTEDGNRKDRRNREDSPEDGNRRDRRNREDSPEDGNKRDRRNREDSPEDGNRRDRRNRDEHEDVEKFKKRDRGEKVYRSKEDNESQRKEQSERSSSRSVRNEREDRSRRR